MIRRLREFLRRVFLHGPLLDWWAARRARQWENAFQQQLTHFPNQQAPAASAAAITRVGPLRRILFVADCMWELTDLVPELRKIADVTVLDLQPTLKRKDRSIPDREVVARTIAEFATAQKNLTPDVVFFYSRASLLSQEAFDILRRRWKCPLLGMNLDDKIEFFPYRIFAAGNDDYQRWARLFDLNLTSTLAATDWYHQRGLPCLYMPAGVRQPAGMSAPSSADFKYSLAFIGSLKPERKVIVEQILAAGVPVQLFGEGWPNSQWIDDPVAVYRSTQLNLGIGFASPSRIVTALKARDFQCPGVGGCYLTTYNWELALHFELGKEILCYRSVEEFLEIHSFYRRRPEACLAIGQAAWRRCANEHTWEKRFRKVFLEAGFKLQ